MAKKKLTTQEILAAARAQAAEKQGADQSAAENASAAEETSTSKQPSPSGETSDVGSEPKTQKPAASRPASGGSRPKSTKDILAAARGQAKGSADSTEASPSTQAPAKPAKKQDAGKGEPSKAGSSPKPSVQEMLKAFREGHKLQPAEADREEKTGDAAQTKAKPTLPPAPVKPPPTARPARKTGQPTGQPRRNFLLALIISPFALAWTLLSVTSALYVLLTARFMFPNVLVEPPSIFKVGPPNDYPYATVSTKWKQQFGVWIVHMEFAGRNIIYALRTVCTHLGCTPNWLEGEQKFKCPCHGSGFYITGINFEGPAPRPLERYGIRLAEDGMLQVDKSVKFQQELGQWDDPNSYVEVV